MCAVGIAVLLVCGCTHPGSPTHSAHCYLTVVCTESKCCVALCSEASRAVQAKVDCLEVEKRSLEAQLLSERRQATESAKEALSLKGQLEEEKGAASKARQQAEELRDTIRHLEDEAELMKVRMCDVCACVRVCMFVC